MIKINLIAAMDRNRNIGLNDDMPWGKTMPSDLRRFKEITTGGAIIMGRKTYESIGRPLPDRLNIVMTRDVTYDPPELRVMRDMPGKLYSRWNEGNASLDLVSDYEPQSIQTVSVNAQQAVTVASLFGYDEVFVIGGAQIYQEFMPYADMIYITKILANLEGDTQFPSITGNWKIHQEPLIRQSGDKYSSQYITYERVREE